MFDHYCQPSDSKDDWVNLMKYAGRSTDTSRRVLSIIENFRVTKADTEWQVSINFTAALFSSVFITEGADKMRFVLHYMQDSIRSLCNNNEDQIKFCMEYIKLLNSPTGENPSPKMFLLTHTSTALLLAPGTPLSESSWAGKENTRRLSVSEEVLNITRHHDERQRDFHQKKQIDDFKRRIETAEEENKELINERNALFDLNNQQELELKKLNSRLEKVTDYEQLQANSKLSILKMNELSDENRRLKHCASENEVLKARCSNYLQQRDNLEQRITDSLNKIEELNGQLEESSQLMLSKTAALQDVAEDLENAKVENERLVRLLNDAEYHTPHSHTHLSSTSSDQSFPVPLNISGVPFELELQNDQLKSQLEERRNEVIEKDDIISGYRDKIGLEKKSHLDMMTQKIEDIAELNEKLIRIGQELSDSKLQHHEKNGKISDLERELLDKTEMCKKNAALQKVVDDECKKSKTLSSELDQLSHEATSSKEVIEKLQANLSAEVDVSKALTEEKTTFQKLAAIHLCSIAELQSTSDRLKEELSATQTSKSEAIVNYQRLENELQISHSNYCELKLKAAQFETDLKNVTVARDAIELDTTVTIKTLSENMGTIRTECASLRDERDHLTASLNSEIETSRRITAEKLSGKESDNKVLEELQRKFDLLETENKQLEDAVSTATEAKEMVDANSASRIEKIETEFSSLRDERDHLLEALKLKEASDNKLTELQTKYSLLESENRQLEQAASATTAAKKIVDANLGSKIETLTELQTKCTAVESENIQLEKVASEANADRGKFKQLYIQLQSTVADLNVKREALCTDHSNTIEDLERSKKSIEAKLTKETCKNQKMIEHVKLTDANYETLHTKYEARKQELTEKTAENTRLVESLITSQQSIKSLERAKESISSEKSEADDQVMIEKQKTQHSERGLNITLEKMAKERSKMKDEKNESVLKYNQLKEQFDEVNDDLVTIQEEFNTLSQEKQSIETVNKDLKNQLDSSKRHIEDLQHHSLGFTTSSDVSLI